MLTVLRTPDERFEDLPCYNYEPHYTTVTDYDGGEIRIHMIDEGPRDAEPIVLMHGNPTWSYIYRKMIPGLLATGRRVIAVDLVGCGRSDKPANKSDYNLVRHVDWMAKWLVANDLRNITLFCQDWGGTIGLHLVANHPERFDRVVAANTGMPTGTGGNKWLTIWLIAMRYMSRFPWTMAFKPHLKAPGFSAAELEAYTTAPFPSKAYQAGITQFPQLIAIHADNPGTPFNRIAWEKLKSFNKPFLTLFGDQDPITKGKHKVLQRHIPGAEGQNHQVIAGGGHFIQEDKPEELLKYIIPFLDVK